MITLHGKPWQIVQFWTDMALRYGDIPIIDIPTHDLQFWAAYKGRPVEPIEPGDFNSN